MNYAQYLLAVASAVAAVPSPGADGRYTIQAPGIRAQVLEHSLLLMFLPLHSISNPTPLSSPMLLLLYMLVSQQLTD